MTNLEDLSRNQRNSHSFLNFQQTNISVKLVYQYIVPKTGHKFVYQNLKISNDKNLFKRI